jgi:hypothetical protein
MKLVIHLSDNEAKKLLLLNHISLISEEQNRLHSIYVKLQKMLDKLKEQKKNDLSFLANA